MGKYIIEVDESEIVECWNEQSVKELGYQEYALKQCPGIKVKSYNPSGDLISRELLKNDIEAQISDFNELNKKGKPYKDFKDIRAILFGLVIGKNLIDNAPPVDAIVNTIEVRTKGEWINKHYDGGFWYHTCNQCKEELEIKSTENFCRNCGADMRKGDTE